MLHCDLRVQWKVASDLRFRAAISEPKTPSFCRISGDLAHSTRKSVAIAIVRFWCAKVFVAYGNFPEGQKHTNCHFSLCRVGENRVSQGVETRGSLISVPLALRVGLVFLLLTDESRFGLLYLRWKIGFVFLLTVPPSGNWVWSFLLTA